MSFVVFKRPFKSAATILEGAGDVREHRDDRAGHIAGILVERASADRAGFVSELPTVGDLVLALRAHNVAHGASRDRDAGGDLVAHGALHLSFQLLYHWFVFSLDIDFNFNI